MKIAVALKQVPDLVEELEVDESGKGLDTEYLKFRINEYDEHALEEAICIKETGQADEVTAFAFECEDTERMLFGALAKGADRAVMLRGDTPANSHQLARAFADAFGSGYDLIMTGVQSVDDRDGQIAPILSTILQYPSISVVTHVEIQGGSGLIHKEYFGGLMAEFEVELPAVLGIQAARQTPRYAPVSKVRQIQQSASIEEITVKTQVDGVVSEIGSMAPPEKVAGAKMLGSVDELIEVLRENGVV